jgi:hypothetical protein
LTSSGQKQFYWTRAWTGGNERSSERTQHRATSQCDIQALGEQLPADLPGCYEQQNSQALRIHLVVDTGYVLLRTSFGLITKACPVNTGKRSYFQDNYLPFDTETLDEEYVLGADILNAISKRVAWGRSIPQNLVQLCVIKQETCSKPWHGGFAFHTHHRRFYFIALYLDCDQEIQPDGRFHLCEQSRS